MKACGRRWERRYNSTYLSPKLNGHDRSTSLSGRFIPTEKSPGYPNEEEAGQGRIWKLRRTGNSIAPTRNPSDRPGVSSHYAVYSTVGPVVWLPPAVTAPAALYSDHTVYRVIRLAVTTNIANFHLQYSSLYGTVRMFREIIWNANLMQ